MSRWPPYGLHYGSSRFGLRKSGNESLGIVVLIIVSLYIRPPFLMKGRCLLFPLVQKNKRVHPLQRTDYIEY